MNTMFEDRLLCSFDLFILICLLAAGWNSAVPDYLVDLSTLLVVSD